MIWNCDSPTLTPEEVLQDRFERIEARAAALRELEAYLAGVRRSDRVEALLQEIAA